MRKPRATKFTPSQIELVTQFAEYAFDHPRLLFYEIARKVLPKGWKTEDQHILTNAWSLVSWESGISCSNFPA